MARVPMMEQNARGNIGHLTIPAGKEIVATRFNARDNAR
jgi:hypothetical protein